MKPDQVRAVLDQLDAYWPRIPDRDDPNGERLAAQLAVWARDLAAWDAYDALDVLDELHRSDSRRPTWARFLEVAKAMRRRPVDRRLALARRCDCDRGWLWVNDSTVMPCSVCQPDLALRHGEGEFAPIVHNAGVSDDELANTSAWVAHLREKYALRPQELTA